jgi:transcriptional regulator with XRE-family HTH domain
MDGDSLLGEFLRARREVTTPGEVGLPDVCPRRTPGLRREEVAILAGVSVDYYIRLEQGRERGPSGQVVAALARALCLGPDAAAHLHELARPRPFPRHVPSREVSHQVRGLLRNWPGTAAVVLDCWMDVLAANSLGTALFGGLHEGPYGRLGKGDNLLRTIFLDPAVRESYRDWEVVAHGLVANLRLVAGGDLNDPRLAELVAELSATSSDFHRIWARHDVHGIPTDAKRFHHAMVGDITVTCQLFHLSSAPGQQLLTVQAEPDGPSARAMGMLAEIAREHDHASSNASV